METHNGEYVADRNEMEADRDIEREMNTTDGLGAEVAAVKKADRNETDIRDGNGHRLRVGEEVHVVGTKHSGEENFGTITNISDPDGDLDDYGRQIELPPVVSVDFRDGTDEDFPARYVYPENYHEVDDIEAL